MTFNSSAKHGAEKMARMNSIWSSDSQFSFKKSPPNSKKLDFSMEAGDFMSRMDAISF
mgnify:CR=1 FL=1